MAFLKFSEELFLGRYELEKFREFLDEDGFRVLLLNNMVQPGLTRNQSVFFDNGLVEKDSQVNTIKHKELFAVDKDGLFLRLSQKDSILVPADGNWYWLRIKHKYNQEEEGTVSINDDGTIVGVGTKFLTSLRSSNTDYPTIIKLIGSQSNTQEYEVLQVIDDVNAILNITSSNPETGLKYRILGTFTPGKLPSDEEQRVFNYDSCELSFIQETILNTFPSFEDGKEFFLARVRSIGNDVEVQDKRSLFLFRTKEAFETQQLQDQINPVIGVEEVSFSSPFSPRHKNIARVAWGLRTTQWTFDSSANRVTLIDAVGGKYKDSTFFSDGELDGWRLYFANGKYSKIKQSSRTGTQISLLLDSLDVDNLFQSNQELKVVQDCDAITIIARPSGAGLNFQDVKVYFDINLPFAKIELPATEELTSSYEFFYQCSTNKIYSNFRRFPFDSIGFLAPESFNDNGSLKPVEDRVNIPYENVLTFNNSSSIYSRRISALETGDLFGVTRFLVDTSTPQYDFKVGRETRYQHVEGAAVRDVDLKFNFFTQGARNGSSFIFTFDTAIIFGSNTFQVIQDLGIAGKEKLLFVFLSNHREAANQNRLIARFDFDGTDWIPSVTIGASQDKKFLEVLASGTENVGDFTGSEVILIDHNLNSLDYNVIYTVQAVTPDFGNDKIIHSVSARRLNDFGIYLKETEGQVQDVEIAWWCVKR